MTCARRPAGARKPAPSAGSPSRPEPRSGRRRARLSGFLSALALLLGALGLFAAAPAAADVLVSNIGQTHNNWVTSEGQSVAQGFATGSNPGGYFLESIEAVLGRNANAQQRATIRAELWSVGNDNQPGKKVVDLGVPSSVESGTVSFWAPIRTELSASTTYFFVLYTTGAWSPAISGTLSDDEDSASLAGWKIQNSLRFQARNLPTGRFYTTNTGRSLRIQVSGAETSLPDKPVRMSVTPFNRQLHVSWDYETYTGPTVATGYDVHYTSAPKAGQGAVADDAAAQTGTPAAGWVAVPHGISTALVIGNLDNDTAYRLRVRATNRAGAGGWLHGQGAPQARGNVPAVRDLRVTASEDGVLRVDWTAPAVVTSHRLTGYVVQYKKAAETAWQTLTPASSPGDADYTRLIQGLDDTVSYDVRVRATYARRVSHWVSGSATPNASRPSVPQNVQVTPGDSKLTLTWQTPASWGTWTPDGFEIEHNLAGAWNSVADERYDSLDPTLTSFVFQGTHRPGSRSVTNGSEHGLRIRALSQKPGTDGTENSHFKRSAWVTVSGTPVAATTAPGAVTSLAATPGDGTVHLAWTAPAGEVTGYEVHRTISITVDDDAMGLESGDLTTSWILFGLASRPSLSRDATNSVAYRLRVRAKNSAGAGPWAFVRVTPQATTAPVAQWARSAVTVAETDADKRVKLDIVLSEALTDAVVLAVSQTAGTATGSGTGKDWEKLSAEACVTGSSADASLSCTIVVTGDDVEEPDETVELTLAVTSGTVTVGTRSVITVTIEDDDTSVLPPGAPRNVQVTPGDAKLVLTWDAPASWGTWPAEGFNIRHDIGGSFAGNFVGDTRFDSSDPTLTRFVFQGSYASQVVTNGTEYSLQIRAWTQKPGTDGSDPSHFRDSAWVTVSGTPVAATSAPGAVTSLAATPGDGTIHLAWTPPSGEITGYDVHRTTSTVADNAAVGTNSATGWVSATYNDANRRPAWSVTAANAVAQRHRVRAKNSAGAGPWTFVTATAQATTAPVAQWARSAVTVAETDADRRVTLDIVLSEALTDAVVIAVSQTGGTATGSGTGKDWEKLSAEACVSGSSGDTSLSCTIVVTGDDVEEPDETVELTLAVTSGTVTVGTRSVITVTIEDDDAPLDTLWSATLTPVSTGSGFVGCASKSQCDSALSDNSFTVGGTEFHFTTVRYSSTLGGFEVVVSPDSNPELRALQFCSGSVAVRMNDGGNSRDQLIHKQGVGLGWTVNAPVEIRLGSDCADAAPPSAPRNLQSSPGNGSLTVSWDPPSEGVVTGYRTEWKEQSAPDAAAATPGDPATGWVGLDHSGANTGSYRIPGLDNGTAYDVRVRASSAAGDGTWATGAGTPEVAPAAPAGLAVTPGATQLALSWTAPAGSLTGYDVHYTSAPKTGQGAVTDGAAVQTGADSAGWVAVERGEEADPPAASQTITGLTDDTAYRVRVRARNAAGEGAWAFGTGTPTTAALIRVTLSVSPDPVTEGASVTVTATLSSRLSSRVEIPLTVTRDTAEAGDFGSLASIAIGAGRTSGAGTIATVQDDDTDDETFTVALDAANLPATVVAGATASVTVTIDDDDAAVTLSAAPNPVTEGESVTVTATLSRAVARSVTVPVTVTAGTAEAGDYGSLTGIRIPGGRTSGTGRIATRQDDDSDDETFTVALAANLPSTVVAGATASVTVTIDDDDTPAVTLSASPRGTVAAGGSVTITASLSAALPGDVTIPLTLTPDAGTSSSDYGTLSSITIAAGTTSGTGTISTRRDGDTVYQSFWVGLGDLPAEVQQGVRSRVRVTIAPAPVPIVWLEATTKTVDEGGTATVTAKLTQALNPAAAVTIPLTARFVGGPSAGHALTIPAGATSGTLGIAIPYDDDANPETLIVEIDTRMLSGVDPQVRVDPYSSQHPIQVLITVRDIPALETARATAREGRDDAVAFTVRLSYPPNDGAVTVNYTTVQAAGAWQGAAPATAGADYTAASGTLAFARGQSSKTVRVPIHDDAVDEGTEYFLLRFSNPEGAYLKAGETQGLITNDDHLQTMWLARFGRTVGSQVTDAVSERLEGGLAPGAHARLAGQSVDLSKTDDGKALADVLTGFARAFGAPGAPAANDDGPFERHGPSGAWNDPAARTSAGTAARSLDGRPARSMTGRQLLLGSSFNLATEGEGSGPGLAAWGRVAHGRFDGEHADDTGRTGVDGEVVTGILGADADWGRLLAGVAVSLSEGEGGFDSPGVDRGESGRIESTLTTVSPYARFSLTERVTAWGLAGWGTGDMTIRFDDGSMAPVRTDLSMQLGAIGARGALMEQDEAGGMDLALKADAFFVRMESEAAANSAETEADASRVRLVLEGGRRFALSETATLRPSLELGLRHDGGDAETGAGVELGGGVAWVDTASGLSIEAKARMLAAHADSDYEEWGASASARLDPGERGRGLSLSLSPTIGASSSASERLWGARDARALAPGGEFDAARGLRAEAGYGVSLFGDRFTGTPNVGFGLSDTAREYRMGWRLTSAVTGDPGFEVSLDATRREASNDNDAEHALMLRSAIAW